MLVLLFKQLLSLFTLYGLRCYSNYLHFFVQLFFSFTFFVIGLDSVTHINKFRDAARNFSKQDRIYGVRALRKTFYLQQMEERPSRAKIRSYFTQKLLKFRPIDEHNHGIFFFHFTKNLTDMALSVPYNYGIFKFGIIKRLVRSRKLSSGQI